MKQGNLVLVILFVVFFSSVSFAQSIIYVDIDASGLGDGSSWANAYNCPQDAIDVALPNDSIWVAEGLYLPPRDFQSNPNPTDPRQKRFLVSKSVRIFGGFSGSESKFTERDFRNNLSILSGDLGVENNNADNAYHVMSIRGVFIGPSCEIDGLQLQDGNANVYALTRDIGGGIYIIGTNNVEVGPTIRNCTFLNNFALSGGGAIMADGASGGKANPHIINCRFEGNGSTDGGGAVHLNSAYYYSTTNGLADVTITNSEFYNNSGKAAIYSNTLMGTDKLTLNNCSIGGNSKGIEAIISEGVNIVILNNTLIAKNTINLDLDAGVTLTNNSSIVSTDLFFLDLNNGDLSLRYCSDAVNAGDNSLNSTSFDLVGNPRVQEAIIDVGAYEYDPANTPVLGSRIYVNANAVGCDDGSTWDNAFLDLQEALDIASKDDEVWVAQGTYVPSRDRLGNPSPADLREKLFYVDKDLKIFGGFAGGESSLAQRDHVANPTILSGVIGSAGTSADSVYHVFYIKGNSGIDSISHDFELDGFTVTGGLSNETSEAQRQDRGAGIFIDGEGAGNAASPTIRNCTFTGNSSYLGGGGLLANGISGGSSNPYIYNCNFEGNHSNITGSAMWIDGQVGSATTKVYNSRFYDNQGDDGVYRAAIAGRPDGGFVDIDLINCTVAGNFPAGILAYDNSGPGPRKYNLRLKNTILFSNVVDIVTYGEYNQFFESSTVGEDPLFIDMSNGDLRISNCSPSLNGGNNALNPTSEDLDGNARIQNTTIDLGAYESALDVIPPVTGVTKRYVDVNSAICGDGSSWALPLKDLQDAIDASAAGDSIWIADGTYFPFRDRFGNNAPTDPRDKTFFIGENIKVFGGFNGGELNLEDRDPSTYETLLSGDLGTAATVADNAYHVLTVRRNSSAFVISNDCEISGITFAHGNANHADYPNDRGAGIFLMGNGPSNECSPLISECKIISNRSNYGGGIDAEASSGGLSSPTIINTRFDQNFSTNNGAAFLANSLFGGESYPSLINCRFSLNTTGNPNSYGFISGNSYATGKTDLKVINCSIVNNDAVVFSGSADNVGDFIYTIHNTVTFMNRALVGENNNLSFAGNSNNLIEIDANFADWPNGDLTLTSCSPAINAGGNSFNVTSEDILGNVRVQSGIVDIGAYESAFTNYNRDIIYVDLSATGCNNGSNWDNAFLSLQDALDVANELDTIWVAGGIYFPSKDITGNSTPTDNRKKTFYIDKDLKLFGGFSGVENSIEERNLLTSSTVLSGNIEETHNFDNSYHVVYMRDADFPNNMTSSCELDGFIIHSGRADVDQANLDDRGAGLAILARGSVGGVPNKNYATIRNCSFGNHFSALGGAGIYIDGTSGGDAQPSIINCSLSSNTTTSNASGIWVDAGFGGNAEPKIIGCELSNNYGGLGAIVGRSSTGILDVELINCTLSDNDGSGVYIYGTNGNPSQLTITNSVLYGNPTPLILDSDIQTAGPVDIDIVNSMIGQDPLFMSAPGTQYALQPCSEAVNTGTSSILLPTKDRLGNDRVQSVAVDMGAFESNYTREPIISNILYVDASSTGCSNLGTSWENAFTDLQDAIDRAKPTDSIWVAAGFYIPNREPGSMNDSRESTFYISKDVQLFGGFNGNETEFDQRNVSAHPTLLSGDRGAIGDLTDNSYHVIYLHGINQEITEKCQINGFTIQDGRDRGGAGILVEPGVSDIGLSIEQCVFKDNYSTGGVIKMSGNSNVKINRCTFKDNTDANKSGVINVDVYTDSSELIVTNSVFTRNSSFSSFPLSFLSSVISARASTQGLISLQLVNNTFFSNFTEVDITGSVFQSNINLLLANSLLEGNLDGTADMNVFEFNNLIEEYPHYTNPGQDDFTLLPCSPAINVGSNFINNSLIDIQGNTRIQQGTIDIGAYESSFVSDQVSSTRIYVNAGAAGCNTGFSWNNPMTNLQNAIDMADEGDSILVAAGTYIPSNNLFGPSAGRDASFFLTDPIQLYGGFEGNEPKIYNFASRDFIANETVLDGNGNYHVVTAFNAGQGTMLDGFTVKNGNADSGAASFFKNDHGGGVYAQSSILKILNCVIKNNVATFGSGIFSLNSNIDLENSTIELNTSTGGQESDILVQGGDLKVKDVEVKN